MELPVYNEEQPGITYYYSALGVYNLGMVNHAHVYGDGKASEHMYCHVYHEGVGKKGANNNVSSLIVKTLRQLNLLLDDSAGGELNVIFDNCLGQNKNNTVLKLAAWLKAMGFFYTVNFTFLVVGHTKNAADRLFNSLKHEYRKRNIFTMEDLVFQLNVSTSVTVIPTSHEDFLDYDTLLKGMYIDLAGKIKQNHVFSCSGDDLTSVSIYLRRSNLEDHTTTTHKVSKRSRKFNSVAEVRDYSSSRLKPLKNVGMNPYKVVEMWKNYRPNIPIEYHDNVLYVEPTPAQWAKVKDEKCDRSEFRAGLKMKKYGENKATKEKIESVAFGDGTADS